MENRSVLKTYHLLPVRKKVLAGVWIGGFAGALLTTGSYLTLLSSAYLDPRKDDFLRLLSSAQYAVTMFPSALIYHFLGWNWPVGYGKDVTVRIFILNFVVNSLLLGVSSGLTAYAFQKLKTTKK